MCPIVWRHLWSAVQCNGSECVWMEWYRQYSDVIYQTKLIINKLLWYFCFYFGSAIRHRTNIHFDCIYLWTWYRKSPAELVPFRVSTQRKYGWINCFVLSCAIAAIAAGAATHSPQEYVNVKNVVYVRFPSTYNVTFGAEKRFKMKKGNAKNSPTFAYK